jgi:hypothetical protein
MMKNNPVFAAFVILGLTFSGQASQPGLESSPPIPEKSPWEFASSAYAYVPHYDPAFLNINLMGDRGPLHLEARYNYEAVDSGSLWVGANYTAGEKLVFKATPMVGGIFGSLDGIAPGLNLSLSYWKLSWSTQAEYVVDFSDHSKNFLYTWGEVAFSPVEWFRIGLATQRTKAYREGLDIVRGPFVGFSYKRYDLATYMFDPGSRAPAFVVGLSMKF